MLLEVCLFASNIEFSRCRAFVEADEEPKDAAGSMPSQTQLWSSSSFVQASEANGAPKMRVATVRTRTKWKSAGRMMDEFRGIRKGYLQLEKVALVVMRA